MLHSYDINMSVPKPQLAHGHCNDHPCLNAPIDVSSMKAKCDAALLSCSTFAKSVSSCLSEGHSCRAHLAQGGSCGHPRDNARNDVSQIVPAHETAGQCCPSRPHHYGKRHSRVPCMQPHQRKDGQKGRPAHRTPAMSRPVALLPRALYCNISTMCLPLHLCTMETPCSVRCSIVTWLHARWGRSSGLLPQPKGSRWHYCTQVWVS